MKSDFSTDLKDVPVIEALDKTNYLGLWTSLNTEEQMKVYKNTEASNFFSVPRCSGNVCFLPRRVILQLFINMVRHNLKGI